MATLVFFDQGATPERVLSVRRLADPASFRTATDVVITPDLSALEGVVPEKYWKHVTGTIVEMTTQEKSDFEAAIVARQVAQEAARLVSIRSEAASGLNEFEVTPILLPLLQGYPLHLTRHPL